MHISEIGWLYLPQNAQSLKSEFFSEDRFWENVVGMGQRWLNAEIYSDRSMILYLKVITRLHRHFHLMLRDQTYSKQKCIMIPSNATNYSYNFRGFRLLMITIFRIWMWEKKGYNVVSIWRDLVKKHPEKIAFIMDDRSLTFRQVNNVFIYSVTLRIFVLL